MVISNFILQTSVVSDSLSAAATSASSATAPALENVSYLSFVLKGGVMIIPIIILLFFCIYIIIERYLSIKKIAKTDKNLLEEVSLQIRNGKLENAILLCKRDNSASSNILRSGISLIGRPIGEIESVMEKTANIEIGEMEKGLGYLGLISGIAPILGFIGTISGVIKIFYSISVTENISIGNISGGLYEKMISSGAGLVVGVVAYSGYHLFNMMIDKFLHRAQKQILEVITLIQSPQHGH